MLTYISQGGLLGDVGPKYSWGLRVAGQKLSAAYPGKVRLEHFDHTQDQQVLDALLKAHARGDQIMMTSHSLGANDFLNRVCAFAAARGITIGNAVTFDPTWNVWASYVGNEVRRVINYYNTDFFSLLGKRQVYAKDGYTGHIANIPLLAMHQNVDDDLGAHATIVREGGWLITPQSGSATLPPAAKAPVVATPIAKAPAAPAPASPKAGSAPDLSKEFPRTDNIS